MSNLRDIRYCGVFDCIEKMSDLNKGDYALIMQDVNSGAEYLFIVKRADANVLKIGIEDKMDLASKAFTAKYLPEVINDIHTRFSFHYR